MDILERAALEDAVAQLAVGDRDIAGTLARYSAQRRAAIGPALQTGRAIQHRFLDPGPARPR